MRPNLKTFISFLLIISFLLPSISLAFLNDTQYTDQCHLKGILQNILKKIVEEIKKFIKAVIYAGICWLTGGFFCPSVETIDDPATQQLTTKEYIYDPINRCIAKGVLDRAVNGVLDIVRKQGRDGGPTYVQNWRNFQTNSQYRGEGIFRAELSTTTLCNYFGNAIKTLFGATAPTSLPPSQNLRVNNFDPFKLRANCTLPPNFNMADYQKDFAGNGGWNAWSRLLEPQNNYYGALFGSLDEASRQRALEESGAINETQGHGFTAIRGSDATDSCQIMGRNGKCLIYKDIKNPGTILADSVAATVNQDLGWVVSSDEINELMGDIFSRLTSRLKNLGQPDVKVPIELVDAAEVGGGLTDYGPGPVEPPPGTEPDSLLSDIQAERANYGTPMTPAQLASLLNTVAWKNQSNGWGLLSKPSGNNCPFASGPIACDILFHEPSGLHYDVLSDAEGVATPTWNLVGSIDISRWVAPVQP